jgi:chromate reductase
MSKKIAVVVGSLRKGSFSGIVAKTLMGLLPQGYEAQVVEIGQLPLYNQDFDLAGNTPQSYTDFRRQIAGFDAVLFVTPEHNRSVPAALKNALDIGSRPYGSSVWNAKPAMVVSVSPGATGGFGANHHLRQTLTFLNMPVVQQPEAYIGSVMSLINEEGKITKPETLTYFKSLVTAFAALIK